MGYWLGPLTERSTRDTEKGSTCCTHATTSVASMLRTRYDLVRIAIALLITAAIAPGGLTLTVTHSQSGAESVGGHRGPSNSFGYIDGGIDLTHLDFFGVEIESRFQAHISERYVHRKRPGIILCA